MNTVTIEGTDEETVPVESLPGGTLVTSKCSGTFLKP